MPGEARNPDAWRVALPLAEKFALAVDRPVEEWMEWEGWESHVGCVKCRELKEDAPCWGKDWCHGYREGCGCSRCWDRHWWDATGGNEVPRERLSALKKIGRREGMDYPVWREQRLMAVRARRVRKRAPQD